MRTMEIVSIVRRSPAFSWAPLRPTFSIVSASTSIKLIDKWQIPSSACDFSAQPQQRGYFSSFTQLVIPDFVRQGQTRKGFFGRRSVRLNAQHV